MKKTIIALLALAGVAGAASVGYSGLDTTMQQNVVLGYDWDNGVSVGTLTGGAATEAGQLTYTGSDKANTTITTNTSWTLSFDICTLSTNDWTDVVCLYSSVADDTTENRKIKIQHGKGQLHVYNVCKADGWGNPTEGGVYFDGAEWDERTETNVDTGIVNDQVTKPVTLTLVSDAKEEGGTFTVYIDGEEAGTWDNWNPDGSLAQVTFGGGTRNIDGTVVIDNLTIWNKALSGSEVKSLIVPEPTTATLSLLALAGLAARRRRH